MKLGITMLIHNKDDIEFFTEFPCFWDTLYKRQLYNFAIFSNLLDFFSNQTRKIKFDKTFLILENTDQIDFKLNLNKFVLTKH